MIAKKRITKSDENIQTSKEEREGDLSTLQGKHIQREKNFSAEVVPLNEDIFVKKAKDGDKEAFKYLVEKYQKRAFAVAFSVTQSYEDAEDVVQESFVKAFYSLKSFK